VVAPDGSIHTVVVGAMPSSIIYNPVTDSVYVANRDSATVSRIVAVTTEAPVITTPTLPDAAYGEPYTQTITATGDPTITFAVTGGDLPDGLTLASGGTITGTPTTLESAPFTVTATNTVGTDAATYTIRVTARAPIITTPSLPQATVDDPYDTVITATGTAPLTFEIAAGDLPAGLTLDPTTGRITGTPTASGTSVFTIRATNIAGTDTAEYTLDSTEAPVTPSPTPTPTVPPTARDDSGGLAFTGTDLVPWVAGSALLLGSGLTALLAARRRRIRQGL
jgi:hypothetical protein